MTYSVGYALTSGYNALNNQEINMLEQLLLSINTAPEWFGVISAVVTLATAVTLLLDTRSDNPIIDIALKVLNVLAGNVHKNKNADE